MKILFINPPYLRLQSLEYHPFHFPLGLGYLAAVLKEKNYPVKIYNAEIVKESDDFKKYKYLTYEIRIKQHQQYIDALNDDTHFVWKEISQILEEYKPDFVGIRIMSVTSASGHKIAELVKKHNKNCYVAMGGIHVTTLPREVLEDENVDFIAIGESEKTIVELCDMLKEGKNNFEKIDGLGFKKKDKLIFNKPRELIQDLDEVPFPARGVMYFPNELGSSDYGHMMTSRGCPFNCSFCNSAQIWGRKTRFRSTENIMEEIKHVYNKYGTRYFSFHDDSFTLDRERTIRLCKAILKAGLDIKFSCTTRVNLVDEKLLRLMKKAGLANIEFGLESGSQKILDMLHKGTNIDLIKKTVKLTRKLKIRTSAFFLFGTPDETKEDVYKTIKLMKDIKVSEMIYNIFTPYPGTELYERAKKLGLIPDKMDWKLFSIRSPNNHFVKNISKEDFSKLIIEVAQVVDKHNASIFRKIDLFNSKRDYYLKHPVMTARRAIHYIMTPTK